MITIHIVFSLDLTEHSIQDNSSLFWQLLEIKNKQSWAKSLERKFTIRSIQIKLPIFDHFLLTDSRIYLVNLIYKCNIHTAFETASMPRYICVFVCVYIYFFICLLYNSLWAYLNLLSVVNIVFLLLMNKTIMCLTHEHVIWSKYAWIYIAV